MPVLPCDTSAAVPMGATVTAAGATFRTWAPHATDVYVVADPTVLAAGQWTPDPAWRLLPSGDGTWCGRVPELGDGAAYLFWIAGTGSAGFKRDPYARELAAPPAFPNGPCLVRSAADYSWHDAGWRTPAFNDMVIYQFHIGAFYAVDASGSDQRARGARFLDAIDRIDYWRALGVNAVEPLPIQEFPGSYGLGYSGTDYFSPEMDYAVTDPVELDFHLVTINALLARNGQPKLTRADIASDQAQLKCLIDLCHLNGIAVILDVVYNHAGGNFDDRSIAWYDRQSQSANWSGDKRTLYFGNGDHAGGLIFNYPEAGVRQFLIDNAGFLMTEYHVDGLRYDRADVIGDSPAGAGFCRDLMGTLHYRNPAAIQIAEYWDWDRATPVLPPPGGLGFDAAWADGLRESLRNVLSAAGGGASAAIDLDPVRDALYPPQGFPNAWRAVQHLENHDKVYYDPFTNPPGPRAPRIAALADSSNARSLYAQSRARFVTTLLLAAPGIPMLFMGQEFLEDKAWSDDVTDRANLLIWWNGLAQDKRMCDFLACVTDLIALRRAQPALRGEAVRVSKVHNVDRVIVVHRWLEGSGADVVIVASLSEAPHWQYPVGLPHGGAWRELFNSDYYQALPNPACVGNGGQVVADGPGLDGFASSALVTIPAMGAVVLRAM